MGQSEKFSNDM